MAKKIRASELNRDFVRLHSLLDEARGRFAGLLHKTPTPSDQGVILKEIMEVNLRIQKALLLPGLRKTGLGPAIKSLQNRRADLARAIEHPAGMRQFQRASRGFLAHVDGVLDTVGK